MAARAEELDSGDTVEGLVIRGTAGVGPVQVEVFNVVSCHNGLADAVNAAFAAGALVERWWRDGLPVYAQFENATVPQGGPR